MLTNKDIPLEDIDELLKYNWADEEDDWYEHEQERGHIFEAMLRIADWINRIRTERTWRDGDGN